ncbi:MAG: Dabb family protein [Rhizobiaceae bacterium]|nr:Dabb family protein [Rhizobiaceae bacterium]
MIRHCVFLRFRHDVEAQQIKDIFTRFEQLVGTIPGVLAVATGPNVSPEGLDHGNKHGFTMDIESAALRDAYLIHPEHTAISEDLLPLLENGIAGVTVFDLQID